MKDSFELRNLSRDAVLATTVRCANNPLTRGVGLLLRSHVQPDEGLWIAGCSAIHTIGMRAPLDVYFLDREGRVMKIARAVRPQRLSVACRGANTVVELGAGPARAVDVGDRLALQ